MGIHRVWQSALGHITKFFVEIPVPRFLRSWIYPPVIRCLGITLEDAIASQNDYPSVQGIFTRHIQPRTVTSDPCVPIDGTLREFGRFEGGEILPVKAFTNVLLGTEVVHQGSFAVFYLSPKDYHRVHSAVSGTLVSIRHIPGLLWPVNGLGLRICPALYTTNERIVFQIETATGTAWLIMVGALNVSGIHVTVVGEDVVLAPDEQWVGKILVTAGDELGYFALGSAVVLVLPGQHPFISTPGSVRMGSPL